jgi:hypothetical protein
MASREEHGIQQKLQVDRAAPGGPTPARGLCQGFIYAAAEELNAANRDGGVHPRNCMTVEDCWKLCTIPLRPSEVPTLKVTPSGELDKCKWRAAADGSDEKEGIHYFTGSSHHTLH